MTTVGTMLARLLLLLGILVVAVDGHGLTTFGKSPKDTQIQLSPQVRGRECSTEQDCVGISSTSCVPDPRDHKYRCLCGDNNAPINGQCAVQIKGPRHSCNQNEDCMYGAECKLASKGAQRGQKVCLCMDGFAEINYRCSGSTRNAVTVAVLLSILTVILQF